MAPVWEQHASVRGSTGWSSSVRSTWLMRSAEADALDRKIKIRLRVMTL